MTTNAELLEPSFVNMRHGELGELVGLLKQQHDVKYDVVVPGSMLAYSGGQLAVRDGAVRITEEGTEMCHAYLRPTDRFEDLLSGRLSIPRDYMRRMRAHGETDNGYILDANVNTWLRDEPDKKWLVRGFRTDDPDEPGLARALLSDRFSIVDNYDVLLAALAAIKEVGVEVNISSADLTERQMRVCISAPEVAVMAPDLLGNYRSPYSGKSGKDVPVVFAGFVIGNSETGGGAFTLTPRITFKVCDNGMTMTKDAMRQVHLGSALAEGPVRWSDATLNKNVELVKAQTADAVRAFLDRSYLENAVATIDSEAHTPIDNPVETIERVSKKFRFSDTEQAAILDCFIKSGDVTSGGVMQAVTAVAQIIENPDRAADLEDCALDVLHAVA